jgi:nicotinate-nucleotide adenylyltransferase
MSTRRPVARINRPLAPMPPAARRRPDQRLRIGLLGGSFNPAHEGHLAISVAALKLLRLDRVWWLVSPQNPLKATGGMAGLEERLASARAVARHPKIVVSDFEQQAGTRYTVDTLRRLQRRSRARFIWMIGADNLSQLPHWRGWREVVGRVPFVVFDREPYSYRALAGQAALALARARQPERAAARLGDADPPAWVFLRLRRHPVSSTAIRTELGWQAMHEEDAP